MNDVLIWLLTAVHVVVALVLIILILMQKSSEQGVGAAFGGGITETAFGAGTTSALVRITVWCASIMLGTTLILAALHSHRTTELPASISSRVLQSPTPAQANTPVLPGAPSQGGTMTPSAPVTLTPPPANNNTPVESSKPAADSKP